VVLPVIGAEMTNESVWRKTKAICDTAFVADVKKDLEHPDDGGRNLFRNYSN
jgi:hypothetical protein